MVVNDDRQEEKKIDSLSPQNWIALGLIVMFVAVLVMLGFLRSDANWDRLIYLLSGFEAIVFAAVGALFGVSVSRGSIVSAREDAATAKIETREHKDEAHRMSLIAADGRTLARAVLAKVRTGYFADPGMLELATLALELYPDLANENDREALNRASEVAFDEARETRRARAEYDARRLGLDRRDER